MRLTWLADEFRSAGLRVVEEPDWEARGREWRDGRPVGGVQHHTAKPVPRNVRSLYLPKLIKCNFNVKPDGTVHVICAGSCNFSTGPGSKTVLKETQEDIAPSNNAKARKLEDGMDGNPFYINNETDHLGDGGEIPDVQYDAVLACWVVIFKRMGWSANRLIAHGEWTSRKPDPHWNDKDPHQNLEDLRTDLAAALGGAPSARLSMMAVQPKREEEEDAMLPLVFGDGFSEPTGKGRTAKREDVKVLQAMLGMSNDDIDGRYGTETKRKVAEICGGDGEIVDGACFITLQENYMMSFLQVGGNGLTEDEADDLYAAKGHEH
jgi:hypothetical protein